MLYTVQCETRIENDDRFGLVLAFQRRGRHLETVKVIHACNRITEQDAILILNHKALVRRFIMGASISAQQLSHRALIRRRHCAIAYNRVRHLRTVIRLLPNVFVVGARAFRSSELCITFLAELGAFE